MVGGSGIDTLDGGTGADKMLGGAGNDTYYVDDAGDAVREDSTVGVDDGGIDLVNASISFTLEAFVEKLTLTGAAAIDGTGNGLDNSIKGNSAVNQLTGGAGGDVYYADAADIIHDTGASGFDKVLSNTSSTLAAGSGIEQLATKSGVVVGNLTGDEGANTITATSGRTC